MAPFSKILSSRPSWLRVSIRGRPGENPTWRESAPRRRHSFRQRITELAAQWTRRATSFKDRSSSNSFSARLRRSESSSAEPFGRIWTSCTLEVYYCIILCEVNKRRAPQPLTFKRQLSTVNSRQSLIPEQHAGRINQILLIAKHLNEFVWERGDFALQIRGQFA